MKPYVKEFTNDEKLKTAVSILQDKGIDKRMYISYLTTMIEQNV